MPLKKSKTPPEQDLGGQNQRIRRCHVCGTVNLAVSLATMPPAGDEEAAQSCSCCGKHLAPFLFFEESSFDGVNADGYFLSQLPADGVYRPLWGFLAFWPEEGHPFEDKRTRILSSHSRRRQGGKK